MKIYAINSECGIMQDIKAKDVRQAKKIYAEKYGYDFDGARDGDYPGSWYFVEEDGIRIEEYTADAP